MVKITLRFITFYLLFKKLLINLFRSISKKETVLSLSFFPQIPSSGSPRGSEPRVASSATRLPDVQVRERDAELAADAQLASVADRCQRTIYCPGLVLLCK